MELPIFRLTLLANAVLLPVMGMATNWWCISKLTTSADSTLLLRYRFRFRSSEMGKPGRTVDSRKGPSL